MTDHRRFQRLPQLPSNQARLTGEVDDELRFHIDMRVAELQRAGMTAEQARAEALRQFGDLEEARRYCRQMDAERGAERRRIEWWGDARRDVTLAARSLSRWPGAAVTVVVMLSLGIGANVTMFGIVDRLLLRPPAHVVEPDLVKRVYRRAFEEGQQVTDASISYPQLRLLERQLASARSVAGFWSIKLPMGDGRESRQARVTLATASFLPLTGVRLARGRYFTAEEDALPKGSAVAVISHELWRGAFGGRDDILERSVPISGRQFRIVGVTPPGFTDIGVERVDAWVPMTAVAGDILDGIFTKDPWHTVTGIGFLHAVIRLPEAAAATRVTREATLSFRSEIEARKGEAHADSVRPTGLLAPLQVERGPDRTATADIALWLAGMSAIVLLIACANVANLLLARAMARRREIAMRVALGAGRGRLVRQLLAEGMVLAVAGGLGALLVARWGGGMLQRFLVPDVAWGNALEEPRLLAAAAVVALVTGLLTGLVPALQASVPDLTRALRSGAREGGGRTGVTRRLLVAGQAALSVLLLVGAGLFLRSLHAVRTLDLGYEPERVLTVDVDLVGTGITGERMTALYDRFLEGVSNIPGVKSAALGITTPFSTTIDLTIALPGRDSLVLPPEKSPIINAVTPGYFETLQTRIVRGRGIDASDRAGTRPVAVVDELMARTLWPARDPIGECVILVEQPGKPCVEVVGIARGVVWNDFREEPRLQMYVAMAQKTYNFTMRQLYVRGVGDPTLLIGSLREAILREAPSARFVEIRPLARHQEGQLRPWRMGATLFTLFGALALGLAALGLYAVIAHGVSQRTREMGVRMALGAARGDIMRLVVVEAVQVAAVGIGVGAILALAGGSRIGDLLFRTSPRDPLTFGVVVVLLLGVSVLAGVVPAWRATRVSAGEALRVD